MSTTDVVVSHDPLCSMTEPFCRCDLIDRAKKAERERIARNVAALPIRRSVDSVNVTAMRNQIAGMISRGEL